MDLPILCQIAVQSIEAYVALLAIPDFARFVRYRDYEFLNIFKRVEKTDKCIMYKINNKLHSWDDLPAFISKYLNSKYWYKFGRPHRDNDRPAVVIGCDFNGSKYERKEWYLNGLLHRDNDKPAIKYRNGTKKWYRAGELHRDNDRPAIENVDGSKFWYINGVLKRENGLPAIEYKKPPRSSELYERDRIYNMEWVDEENNNVFELNNHDMIS